MSTIYQFELSEGMVAFVKEQVAEGKFHSADEVFEEGLRLLKERTAKREERRAEFAALVKEGLRQLDAGEGILLHGEDELLAFIHGIGQSVRERLANEKLP